jgi:hypothetical protein
MPTSARPYQNQYRKDSKSKDIFKKRKTMVLEKDISEHQIEQMKLWCTFWRRNIHRFIIDAMGIPLFPYQIIWIYLMQISPLFVGICSRTASKSWIVAAFSTARCILYPGLSIIIAATTKAQAGLIISKKITEFKIKSPLVDAEIINITANTNVYEAKFRNGSMITVVAANEGALGNRCNDLIVDEYAISDKEVVDKILKPFLFPRQIPFVVDHPNEFADYIEPIRTCYISSAWYANEWWHKTALSIARQMAMDKSAGFFATDYLSSIRHNLKTIDQIQDEKTENAAFDMQYGNIPGKSNLDAYFQADMFKRTIQKAFYPVRKIDYTKKTNPFFIPRVDSEIRIMGIDLATRSAASNDNSVITCVRLLPSKRGYERKLVYMESSHGADHIEQANRIKNIWYDFKADYLSLDVANIGVDVFVDLSLPYFNEERGIQMPAFTVMNRPEIAQKTRDELLDKTRGTNAIPIIFPISGTPELNSDMNVAFRSSLQKKLWSFLIDDIEAEEFLIKNSKEYFLDTKDSTIQSFMLHPYVQVNFLLMECLALEMKMVNSLVKLDEGNGRKDRFSSTLHANWLASIFDKDLLKEDNDEDDWSVLMGLTQVY